jgi:rubredoxin
MAKLSASAKTDDSCCPHCHLQPKIVSVEIGLTRVVTHSICPNCGLVLTEDPGNIKAKRRKRVTLSLLSRLRLR